MAQSPYTIQTRPTLPMVRHDPPPPPGSAGGTPTSFPRVVGIQDAYYVAGTTIPARESFKTLDEALAFAKAHFPVLNGTVSITHSRIGF